MADINYLNSSFVQQGQICAFACYGIIVEYFSDNEIKVENLLDKYIDRFQLKSFPFGNNKMRRKQNEISKHFHEYCWSKSMRGFDFLRQIHLNDELGVKHYCNIILAKASLESISADDLLLIRNELEQNEALVMVLYKVNARNYHAVVVGFDTNSEEYFYKDPEKSKIYKDDFWKGKEITEFIIFNES